MGGDDSALLGVALLSALFHTLQENLLQLRTKVRRQGILEQTDKALGKETRNPPWKSRAGRRKRSLAAWMESWELQAQGRGKGKHLELLEREREEGSTWRDREKRETSGERRKREREEFKVQPWLSLILKFT